MSDVREHPGDYNPDAEAIQAMTMKVSKGLEFPVVARPGVGHMPVAGEDDKEATRVFYVAATWAMQRLLIGASGDGGFGKWLVRHCCEPRWFTPCVRRTSGAINNPSYALTGATMEPLRNFYGDRQ